MINSKWVCVFTTICHNDIAELDESKARVRTITSIAGHISQHEEFEQQAEYSDSMTQFRSPTVSFFRSIEEEDSTGVLEQGTQTPSPAPDLIPG